MFLYLLFAAVAFGDDCESSTCIVCKANTTCDWYGFDCLSKTSTAVTSLSLTPTSPCVQCQAGSCNDCQNQTGCSWFSSVVPGVPGKCDVNTTTSSAYALVPTCPSCFTSATCDDCVLRENSTGCGWYVLPGGLNGKCREASPSFAYTKVPKGSCATGNPCSGVNSCSSCQAVVVQNSSVCSWFTSKSPSFYNNKCDNSQAGVVDAKLYTQVSGTCPLCAGTSCLSCKAEANCKWVAVQGLTGIAFGECLQTSATTPTTKRDIATCPATCQVHSCKACTGTDSCSWFTGSSVVDDSCDLSSDAKIQHPAQTPLTSTGSCGACMADRCFECNGLPGCGWYVNKKLGVIFLEGCYATNAFPSGRELLPDSDSKCKGVPSSSTHLVASIGLLLALALFA